MSRETGGGKLRPGRGRSSTKPYERRRSWLGRVAETVTDSVRGLLSPWNSSADSSVHEAEVSEHQTAHNDPVPAEQQQQITLPIVRKGEVHRLAMTTPLLQPRIMQFHNTPPFHPRPAAQMHNIAGFQLFRDHVHGNADDRGHDDAHSDISMMSTVVQLDDTDYQDSIALRASHQSPIAPAGQNNYSLISPHESMNNISNISHQDRQHNSLGDDVKLLPHSSKGRPTFKPSLFYSATHDESSFFNEPNTPSFESSFYQGKTTYGGSAARRQIHTRRREVLSSLGRNVVKASPGDATVNVTSNVTKRILNALERMAAPNMGRSADSPDIAARVSPIGHNIQFLMKTPLSGRSSMGTPRPGPRLNRNSDTRTPLAGNAGIKATSAAGPPQTALNVSRIAELGQNNQHLIQIPTKTLDKPLVDPVADRADSPVASADTTHLDSKKPNINATDILIKDRRSSVEGDGADKCIGTDSGVGGGGKIKRERSMHFSSRGWQDDDMPPPMPDLKTDFTLPIKQMPSFGLMRTTIAMPAVDTSMTSPSVHFTFSSPLKMSRTGLTVSSGNCETSLSNSLSFTFASPVPRTSTSAQSAQHKVESTASYKLSTDSRSKLVEKEELKFGGIEPVRKTTGFKFGGVDPIPKTSGLKFGGPVSTLETDGFTFGGTAVTSKPTESSGGLGPCKSSELKFGSVMDILGGKTSQQNSSATSISGQPKLSSDLKPGQNKLVSSQCLPVSLKEPAGASQGHISNGFLPTAISLTTSSASPSPIHPDKKMKPFSVVGQSSWECDTCLVQNKADVNSCVACSSAKPGSSSLNQKQTHESSNTTQTIAQKANLSDMFRKPVGSWSCDACLVQNQADQLKCIACGSTNSSNNTIATSPNNVIPSGVTLSDMFRKPVGNWSCDACLVQNQADQSKCIACGSTSSSNNYTATSPTNVIPSGVTLSDMFRKPVGNWSCDECLVQNKADQLKCVACGSTNSSNNSTATLSNSLTVPKATLSDMFQKPVGNWSCDACLVQNKADQSKCVACGSAKNSNSSPPAPSPGIMGSLLTQFSKPSGTWECDSCMLLNKAEDVKCIACAVPKTGTHASSLKTSNMQMTDTAFSKPANALISSPSGFAFASKDTPTAIGTTTPGFTFGSTTASSACGTTTAGFTFGSNTKTTAGVTTTSGFTFGTPSTPVASVTTTTGFAFGSNPKTTDTVTTMAGFTFGKMFSPTTSVSTTTAGFAFSSNDTLTTSVTTTLGFKFGSNATQTTSSAPSGGFTFGKAPVSGGSASTGVALASTVTVPSENLMPSGFAFNATTIKTTTTNATPTGIMAGGFSFGSTSDSRFGGVSTPNTNLLNDGFKFGAKTTIMTTASLTTATTTTTTTAATGGFATTGFTFGAASTPKAGSAIPGGFTFGATAGVMPSGAQSGLLFGSAPSTTEHSTGGFTFHKPSPASSTNMLPVAGGFSTTSMPDSSAIASNTMLSPTAANDSSLLSKKPFSSSGTGFNFNMAPSFNFGATAAPAVSQGSSIFQFGSSPMATPPVQQQSTVSAIPAIVSAHPTFPATPTQQFNNFGAGAPASDNPFSVASSGSGRIIKKAVRKVRK